MTTVRRARLTAVARACPMIVGIGLVLALLTGCGASDATTPSAPGGQGGSSSSEAPPGSEARTTSSPTTPIAARSTADEALARTATLGLSDFPRDWEVDNDSDDSAAQTHCQTLDRAQAAGRAQAQSPKYTSHTAYASSEVLVFADAVTATHWFNQLAGRATGECAGEQLGRFVAETHGVTIGQITTAGLALAPAGDQDAAERLTIPVSQNGVTIKAFGNVVFVRIGRGIAVIELVRVLSPFDARLGTKLVTAAADRLANELKRAR